MSILEIVLLVTMGIGLAIYITIMTIKMVKKKKKNRKEEQEDGNEEQEKDDTSRNL